MMGTALAVCGKKFVLTILVGLPGAGKSTTLSLTLEQLDHAEVLSYGTFMRNLAKDKGISRDAMRKKLTAEEQRNLGIRAAEAMHKYVMARSKKGIKYFFIDTHAAIKSGNVYIPGLPKEVLEALQPDQIVYLDAPAELIFKRRQMDSSRQRDSEPVFDIEEHDKISKQMMRTMSDHTGIPLHFIRNDGDSAAAAAKLLEFIISAEELATGDWDWDRYDHDTLLAKL